MRVMERQRNTREFHVETTAAALIERLRLFFSERRLQSYLAGGFIRDGLLGRASHDLDVIVDGPALDIGRELADDWGGSFVLLDEANQVARVVIPDTSIHIDISGMRGSLEQDLSLRDFAINAIALSIEDLYQGPLAFVDPFGGLADLEAGQIRVVTDRAFTEDPLRLLRAVRIARHLGFEIEPRTEALIRRQHALIAEVSGERVRDELCLMLADPGAARALRWLDRLGLLLDVVPEMAPAKGSQQPIEHYWDVFEHCIETVTAAECLLRTSPCRQDVLDATPWSAELASHFVKTLSAGRDRQILLKLTALLHDIAKPQTRTFEPSGRMRFFGHGEQGAEIVKGIMERLRFSRREVAMACTMVENHLRPGQLVEENMPTQRAIYRYFRDTGDAGIDTIFLNLADHMAARGPELELDEFAAHARVARYMLEQRTHQQTVTSPRRLIDGDDIMKVFGLPPGPEVGRLLSTVHEAQAVGEIHNREQALRLVKQKLGLAESGSGQGKD